ncbi:MAG: DUF5670 family protein [Tepidisphaeraceae bacterium]
MPEVTTSYPAGGLIHILPVLALAVVVIRLLQGRKRLTQIQTHPARLIAGACRR